VSRLNSEGNRRQGRRLASATYLSALVWTMAIVVTVGSYGQHLLLRILITPVLFCGVVMASRDKSWANPDWKMTLLRLLLSFGPAVAACVLLVEAARRVSVQPGIATILLAIAIIAAAMAVAFSVFSARIERRGQTRSRPGVRR
jgi:predicted anti-sigma-YlaC factor YlaD